MQLSPVQRRIRDFYFKDGLAAPPDVTHVHRAALVPDQQLFSLAHLRRHLNDPLLDLDYLNLFEGGKPVDLSSARLYKLVQKRKIGFVDKRLLQAHFERGAACVLEGLDILEPDINALATALDRGAAATFCNATAFFSQRGNEAYRGHVDTDDVLVIHMAGEKRWTLHRRQAPRRVNLADLEPAQMGAVEAEVVMRPGDVLYLRNYVPHRVATLSPYSLHVSFDLCNRQTSIEAALQLLLRHYDRDSSPRSTPPLADLDKLHQLSRTPAFAADLANVQAGEDAGQAEFRELLATNRITFLDRLLHADPAAKPAVAADKRT